MQQAVITHSGLQPIARAVGRVLGKTVIRTAFLAEAGRFLERHDALPAGATLTLDTVDYGDVRNSILSVSWSRPRANRSLFSAWGDARRISRIFSEQSTLSGARIVRSRDRVTNLADDYKIIVSVQFEEARP